MANKKILIAGRYMHAAEMENSVLGRSDFKVITAYSGREALEAHRRHRADVLVIDLELTDPPAEQVCSAIRADSELRSVSILVTGNATAADRDTAVRCGANHYLARPFSDDMFQEKVSAMLDVSARMSYRVTVSVRVTGQQRSSVFQAFSENLSKTGMLLITQQVLAAGDEIECTLALGDVGLVSLRGKVVRVMPAVSGENRYGTQFTKISMQDTAHLGMFLARQQK